MFQICIINHCHSKFKKIKKKLYHFCKVLCLYCVFGWVNLICIIQTFFFFSTDLFRFSGSKGICFDLLQRVQYMQIQTDLMQTNKRNCKVRGQKDHFCHQKLACIFSSIWIAAVSVKLCVGSQNPGTIGLSLQPDNPESTM